MNDGRRYHYVLIKNLITPIKHVQKKVSWVRETVCPSRFHICVTEALYKNHLSNCRKHDSAVINKPNGRKESLAFRNFYALWFVPVVIYFDVESLIQPVISCANTAQSTEVVEIHRPSGFYIVALETANLNLCSFSGRGQRDVWPVSWVPWSESLRRPTRENNPTAFTRVKYLYTKITDNAGNAKISLCQ